MASRPNKFSNSNQSFDHSTPIYLPNRNSNNKNASESNANKFNFDEHDERPYYAQNENMSSNNNKAESGKVNNASSLTDDANQLESNSVETLKHKQALNPYIQRMQKFKEQQQKQIEAQLQNQNNLVIDSDL